MDGKIQNQRNSGQKKNWRTRESGQSQGQRGSHVERSLLGLAGALEEVFKSALKIRNEERKRENTVGQNEGKKQQEAEKKPPM